MAQHPRPHHWLPLMIAAVLLAAGWWGWPDGSGPAHPIRIGVIHSLSGTMAASESPLVDAVALAVAELNAAGGLLGRPVELLVADGRSDAAHSAREAERLITAEGVRALFGCWTSACRKALKPVVERHRHLLFYPLQYEGLESSPHIVYTGSAPNQQIIPALRWAVERFGPRLYLLGSDYIFPRAANAIIRQAAGLLGAEVVGERYIPLGAIDLDAAMAEISQLRPDVILNTINGDSNAILFQRWFQLFGNTGGVPILSFSIGEPELRQHPGIMAGHYAAWSYFQSLETPANKRFLHAFQAFDQARGNAAGRAVSDPMEASYIGVRLWAQAVADAASPLPEKVLATIDRQSLAAPQGVVSVEPGNHHLWRAIRIGQAQPGGQFQVVWQWARPVRPEPYPSFRSRPFWQQRLTTLTGAGKEGT